MGEYLNYIGVGTKNCFILNNTLFENNQMIGAFGETEGEIRLTEHCENNVVMNNLVYGRDNDVFIHKYTNTGSSNLIDYNYYFAIDGGAWNWEQIQDEHNIHAFSQWQTLSGQDQHSFYGKDPLFKDVQKPDLNLMEQSTVWDSGHLLEDESLYGTYDMNGNARIVNGKISIGAVQQP